MIVRHTLKPRPLVAGASSLPDGHHRVRSDARYFELVHRYDREPLVVALHLPHTELALAETQLKIEVYSDVACPWCFLGERRLERALEKFSGRDDVEVVFRAFQLDPATPERAVPLLAELERKFGANARAMTQRISEAGREEGIDFDWTRALAVNTLTAHRLLRLAEHEYGAEVQRRLATLLFEAHFEDGGDVGDVGELTALAVEAGLDPKRVVAYLSSDEGLAETKADIAAAQDLGITAVPTFVIDDQYAVQGAQPPDVMLEVLSDVARRSGNDTAGVDITEGSR